MSIVQKQTGTGEEKVLLNNIVSLLNQLIQEEKAENTMDSMEVEEMQTGYEVEPDKKVTMSDDKDEDDKKEDVKKSTISTPADNDDTANDDAEKRVETVDTNITDETIQEVAKSILKLAMKSKDVKKSKPVENNGINKLLGEVVKIQKSMLARQEETENAISNLVKGLGIADEIEKNYSVQKSEPVRKGLNNSADVEATLQYIAKALGTKEIEKEDHSANIDKVRKSLSNSSLLAGLVVKK